MNEIDAAIEFRSKYSTSYNGKVIWYGIDTIEGKIEEMLSKRIIEPSIVKEQIIYTDQEIS